MRTLRILLPLFAALLAASLGQAADAIDWQLTSLRASADIFQKEVVAVYPFTNRGAATVRLTEVHPSCGCTVPTLEKDTYEAGETGSITATFTIGNRVGHQVKTIQVYTDEPGRKEPYTLTLTVDIPEAVKLTNRALIWKSDEEAVAKECQIQLHPDLALTIDKVTPLVGGSESSFLIDLVEVEPKSLYNVRVTPLAIGKSARVTLQLHSPSGQAELLKSYLIYAVVYPSAANN